MKMIMDCGGVLLSVRSFKHNCRMPGPRLGLLVQGHLIKWTTLEYYGLPQWLNGNESACTAGDVGEAGSVPGLGKMPWRKKWQPTPVFLPGEFHGQRSLMDFSPWNGKESDTIEHSRAHLNILHAWSSFSHQVPTVALLWTHYNFSNYKAQNTL